MDKNNNSKDLQSEKETNNKVEANDKVEKMKSWKVMIKLKLVKR